MDTSFLVLGFIIIVAIMAVTVAFILGIKTGKLVAAKSFSKDVKKERADAVKRSRAVLNGQFSEQLAAYLPDFPADPTEVRFVGKPVDFIAFCGASSGEIDEIRFIEVKTGNAKLSKVERSLRDAVEKKRIRYCEYRIPS